MKRVSMELGGKSANIVFEDCNFAQAVVGAISGIFCRERSSVRRGFPLAGAEQHQGPFRRSTCEHGCVGTNR